MSPSSTGKTQKALDTLFKRKKARWLPLFHRLSARISRVPNLEMRPVRASIGIHIAGKPLPLLATVRITSQGLLFLCLSRKLTISKTPEIDDEILIWLKAAQHQRRTVHTPKP